jgi:hypothetical protein
MSLDTQSRIEAQIDAVKFQDSVDKVLRAGPLITSWRLVGLAIRDPRVQRPHLRILYNILDRINKTTGTAFPGRHQLAEEERLEYKSVENLLYELRGWGYIDWEKRAEPEFHRGRLHHYTVPIAHWPLERLRDAIRVELEKAKNARPSGQKKYPPRRALLLKKVPAPTGKKVPAPTGSGVLQKELTEKNPPYPPQRRGATAIRLRLLSRSGGRSTRRRPARLPRANAWLSSAKPSLVIADPARGAARRSSSTAAPRLSS